MQESNRTPLPNNILLGEYHMNIFTKRIDLTDNVKNF